MNAYEFGLKYFNETFQPSPNCVIFNDKYRPMSGDVLSNEIDVELPFYFEQVLPITSSHFKRMASPKRLKAEVVEDYLLPNNYIRSFGDNTLENHPDNHFFTVYAYNEMYFVKAGDQAILDQIVISSAKGGITAPKLFGLSEQKLRSIIGRDDVSLIFFFSEDGAVLESGYSSINEIMPNEIVFFLEKDSILNILSVARIKSGIDIVLDEKIPYPAIASLSDFFEAPITEEKLEKVFINHFKDKEPEENDGIWTYLFKIDDYILELAGDGLKLLIGDPLIFIGETIVKELKADPKRWKYYNDDGTVNKEFEPVFPGLKNYLDSQEEKEQLKKSKNLNENVSSISTRIKKAIDKIPNESYKVFLRDKLDFVFRILDSLQKLYQSILDLISFKNAFIYLNAMIIGIYNSLIEAIGGIFTLVGNVVNIPSMLFDVDSNDVKNGLRIGAEILENTIEAFLAFFSIDNILAFFSGLYQGAKVLISFLLNPDQIVSKITDGVNYVATKVDQIGYVVGYIIGFIIEEVLTAILTGGAKTVAQALKMTLDSIVSAVNSVRKVGEKVARKAIDFIHGLSVLFKKMKNLDVKKIMDDFVEWIKKLLKTTRQLAEEAYLRLFKSKSSLEELKRMGYGPTKVVGDVITICRI
jgi:hypothetical protein